MAVGGIPNSSQILRTREFSCWSRSAQASLNFNGSVYYTKSEQIFDQLSGLSYMCQTKT